MAIELKTHPSYSHDEVARFFIKRGWTVVEINAGSVDLVVAERGAAIECYDGRYGKRKPHEIKKHGPKLPGGSNAIAELKTGGDSVGFNAASKEAQDLGYRAGTHPTCGNYRLWRDGKLQSVRFPLALPERIIQQTGKTNSEYIHLKNKLWGGKHVHIEGKHEEEAMTINPFEWMTIVSRKDRLSYDHWVLPKMKIHSRRALLLAAETAERLFDNLRTVELLKL